MFIMFLAHTLLSSCVSVFNLLQFSLSVWSPILAAMVPSGLMSTFY